jgi:hypothetical protein
MGTLEHDRRVIPDILLAHACLPCSDGERATVPAFDRACRPYLVLVAGWLNGGRYPGCLIHAGIASDRRWFQYDGAEDGIAGELVAAGIPTERIILGFHPEWQRPLTGHAVA